MSDDPHKSYIRDLVYLLRERGAEAVEQSRVAQTGQEFHRGRAMAYIEVLSTMQNQAVAFQLAADELLLSGFDPENGPLNPPRPKPLF